MIGLEAVVVYRIFGLSLDAIFALVRLVITPVIIILTLRIPFKRKYHWMFLVVQISFIWLVGWAFLAQLTTYDASKALVYYDISSIATSAVYVLMIYQFVVFFISPKYVDGKNIS